VGLKLLRKYFSLFLLLLITVPVIDRAVDELAHLEEIHCDDNSLHYCQTEHDCPVCDYVFASNASLPKADTSLQLIVSSKVVFNTFVLPSTLILTKAVPSLRGPPSC
jgi:hypothetical protein